MKPFLFSVEHLSLPYANDIDELLYKPIESEIFDQETLSWQGFIYECIIKSKKLINKITDTKSPIVWLLPAWLYQPEQMQLLQTSLQEQFKSKAQHLIFQGASGIDSAIALAHKNNWEKVNIISIDLTYRVNKKGQYVYQGLGEALATLLFNNVGWAQGYFELVPSIDFIKNNILSGMLARLSQTINKPIDLFFTPGNGVQHESEAWLNSLQDISTKITDETCYKFPQYIYGQIGALSGIVNIYMLCTNPTIVEQYQCTVNISQAQDSHQAVALYLWTGEEVLSNG